MDPKVLIVGILILVYIHSSSPEEASNTTTTTVSTTTKALGDNASTPSPNITSGPDEFTLWFTVGKDLFTNVTSLARHTVKRSVEQIRSWGSGVEAIMLPAGLEGKWQALKLIYKAGEPFEQFVNKLKGKSTAEIFSEASVHVAASLSETALYAINGLGNLELLSRRVDGLGSVYFLNNRTGGVVPWEGLTNSLPRSTCKGSRQVVNQPFKSVNIEVHYDVKNTFTTIAYLTSYLGIEVINCPAIMENHGSIALLDRSASLVRVPADDGMVYPIYHITIDHLKLDDNCHVVLCSMREDHYPTKGQIKEADVEKVHFVFTPAARSVRRKLLSIISSPPRLPCSTGTKVVSTIKYEVNTPDHPRAGPYRTFCNGTKTVASYAPSELGCFSTTRKVVRVQCPTHPEHVTLEAGDCSYTRTTDGCEKGHMCITVLTPGRGIVKFATEKERTVEDCIKSCSFSLPGLEATLTCPNGEKHSLVSSEISPKCLMSEYGRLPLWVCRMSFRPVVVYILCAWYFLGYLVWRVLIVLLCLFLSLFARAIKFVRVRKDDTRGTCEQCQLFVEGRLHWQRHENCKNGRCPFCRTSCSTGRLQTHVKECIQRPRCQQEDEEAVTIRYVPYLMRVVTVWLSSMSKTVSKTAWLVGIFVLAYTCVHPAYGLMDTVEEEDLWQKEVDFVNFCDINCYQGEDDCTCGSLGDNVPVLLRKPLSTFPGEDMIKQLIKGRRKPAPGANVQSKKRVIDVTAPWGSLHVDSAYKPSYSGSHISLSWTEVSSTDEHITLNGKSQAVLNLEAGTGLMWEIKSPKAAETKRVFVSILDHTQVYSSRFLYGTGDREIETWMHGRCTGDCPERCSCDSHLCHHSEFDDFTSWKCNPTWCWSIGSGCACCALDVKTPFQDWFVTKWELEYVDSPVIACIETSSEDRICQQVSAGVTLQLGPISVQFSDPSGISKKLPREVAVFHKTPKQDLFDIAKKIKLVDARTMCDVQSCTHGPVGDFQVYSISPLFNRDHTSLTPLANREYLNKTNSWVSWAGVSSFYTCHPGHWPDCHSTGVVQRNTDAFENLWRGGDASVNYFFHSEQINISGPPTMNLKGRPWMGAGQITAMLDVQGLVLKSVKVKPEGLHLDISNCHGCYGCSSGFTCTIRVQITHPDQFTVHLMSEDPNIITPSLSILAKNDQTQSQELFFYAATDTSDFCVRIKEPNADGSIARGCAKASLVAQEGVVLEHRRTLHSTSNSTCVSGYFACLFANSGDFFKNLGGFLGSFFGRFAIGVVVFVVIVSVVALLIFCGPNCIRLLGSCWIRRKGYRKLIPFEEIREEWTAARRGVEEEKQKGAAAQALIDKLSKSK